MSQLPAVFATASREWEILAGFALAMLLGGLIGFEREAANKPAGFRTHMLVAGAGSLFAGLAFALVERSVEFAWADVVAADPVRILQAVVIGVSFLGTGTIVRGRRPADVQGLTTAASLLVSSGIGVAAALRQFVLAIGVTRLVAIVLRLLGRLEAHVHRRAA